MDVSAAISGAKFSHIKNSVVTHLEKSGNLRVVREKSREKGKVGKCVLAYGQLPRVLILTQNVQKRLLNYVLGTAVHHMKSID